jgi:hypothetical protein
MKVTCAWQASGPSLYRAEDSTGDTIDFLLSPTRDAGAAKRFFQSHSDAGLPGISLGLANDSGYRNGEHDSQGADSLAGKELQTRTGCIHSYQIYFKSQSVPDHWRSNVSSRF